VPAGRTYPLPATPTARMAAPAGAATPVTNSPAAPSSDKWYAGRLRRAGRHDYQRLYVLEFSNTNGTTYPGMYVSPQEGTNLEPFVDRNVQLTGPINYNGELRCWYMSVQRAHPLP
jgi:hypothetical protein